MFSLIRAMGAGYFRPELTDPRGGRVPNVSSSLDWNNLHTPYRGLATDFYAPPLEGNGRPMGYLQSMPGLNAQLNSDALRQVLTGIRANQQGRGGQNVQVAYRGMQFGVTENQGVGN